MATFKNTRARLGVEQPCLITVTSGEPIIADLERYEELKRQIEVLDMEVRAGSLRAYELRRAALFRSLGNLVTYGPPQTFVLKPDGARQGLN